MMERFNVIINFGEEVELQERASRRAPTYAPSSAVTEKVKIISSSELVAPFAEVRQHQIAAARLVSRCRDCSREQMSFVGALH